MTALFDRIEAPLYSPEYFRAIRQHLADCGVRILVPDAETGPQKRFLHGNPYGYKDDKLALHPRTAEILLFGLMNEKLEYEGLHGAEEKPLVEEVVERLNDCHHSGGYIVGQNIHIFDLINMTGDRYMLLTGKKPPAWFYLPRYELAKNRILDTTMLVQQKVASFHQTASMSLGNYSKLIEQPLEEYGAEFGRLWNQGDPAVRKQLIHYNKRNCVDSLVIAVHSGIIATQTGLTPRIGLSLSFPRVPWQSSGYEPAAAEPFPRIEMASTDIAYCGFITTPSPGLKDLGPKGDGWADEKKKVEKAKAEGDEKKINAAEKDLEKKIAAFPLSDRGRYGALHSRIAGFFIAGQGRREAEVHLDPDNEGECLNLFLEKINAARGRGRVFARSLDDLRGLALYRGVTHGMVFPGWFMGHDEAKSMADARKFAVEKSEEELIKDVVAHGVDRGIPLGSAAKPIEPPLYLGQDKPEFVDQIKAHAAWMYDYVVSSPALSDLPAPRFALEHLPKPTVRLPIGEETPAPRRPVAPRPKPQPVLEDSPFDLPKKAAIPAPLPTPLPSTAAVPAAGGTRLGRLF